MSNEYQQDERGVIIVFTLILLGVLLSVALSFFYFILLDIKKARAIDNSTVAYYAADAGVERSLYIIKKQEAASSTSALRIIYNQSTAGGDGIFSLANGSEWDVNESSDFEKNFFRQRLVNGESVKLYFLNRQGQGGDPKSFGLRWFRSLAASPNSKMQVAINQLMPQFYQNDQTLQTLVYYAEDNSIVTEDSSGAVAFCYNFRDCNINSDNCETALPNPVDYVVELKALGEIETDDVDHLSVMAYSDADCQTTSTYGVTNLTLKSRGVFNNNRQIIVAHIPPLDPLSGLFGFVLFSENDITKE
ncbi:MAG: hypothetical protein WC668_01405 [Patescibacteria group bacterium]|jgi:hypothetical protein